MAALLLASISWSVDRAGDPLHGISRDDLSLQGCVLEVVVEEAVVTATPSETRTRYEYTYDHDGNWTKRVESVWVFSDDDPGWRAITATVRTIRYAE